MSRQGYIVDADQERNTAHGALIGTLWDLVAAGRTVPCMDPGAAWAWTAEPKEDPNARRMAAELCQSCPGLRDCYAYVTAHPEPVGIWAGMTPDARRKAARERKESA